jgi:hypothetical protein
MNSSDQPKLSPSAVTPALSGDHFDAPIGLIFPPGIKHGICHCFTSTGQLVPGSIAGEPRHGEVEASCRLRPMYINNNSKLNNSAKFVRRTCLLALVCFTTLAIAEEASAQFSDEDSCVALKRFADKANKDAGSMLDRVTRNDGMSVLCETKIIDFNKFLNIDPSALRDGWQERKQQQWNDIYCHDEYWSKAISAGWTVAQTMTFANGKRYWMTAECK